MRDVGQILAQWAQIEKAGESAILATVVKTRGSSYRLPGARMLMTRDGRRLGAVSGGCLEDDLVKKAWWLTERGPVVQRYDTTADGELATGGYGLGCSGVIHVLLERLMPEAGSVLPLLEEVRTARQPAAVAHWIAPAKAVGSRAVLDTRGEFRFDSDPGRNTTLEEAMRAAVAGAGSRVFVLKGNALEDHAEVFVEALVPPVRLLVFGAGDDAVPMTKLAKFLGWQVIVLDGRAHYARSEKFPDADEVIVRRPGEWTDAGQIDPWTAAVVMNHSYRQDLEVVRELSGRQLPYLGLLGPRKRTEQLLLEAGLHAKPVASELHNPMGLDTGADGAEQIALSVIAEIQATLNRRSGGSLRDRYGSIHARDANDHNESPWVRPVACA
ncbi:MAG: XdhC family protein [Acidobacteriaceae bacterium]|nr:XdhC family protein [Acidobacteriaceae bacterium]